MNLGGNSQSSSSGLNDCAIAYHIGRNINTPSITRISVIPISPPVERLRTTLCFLVLNLAISLTYLRNQFFDQQVRRYHDSEQNHSDR